MKIKEAYVTRENPTEIFSIIEDVLSKRRNTQVFVEGKIYTALKKNRHENNIYFPNYLKGFHYYVDCDNFGGEEWVELVDDFNKPIARGSFICNCIGYMQLVEFHSSKVKEYTHYVRGFKQLLLIRFKPESL